MSKFETILEFYKNRLNFLEESDRNNFFGEKRINDFTVDYSFKLSKEKIERMRKNDDWESLEGVIEDDLELQIELLEENSISKEQFEEIEDDYEQLQHEIRNSYNYGQLV